MCMSTGLPEDPIQVQQTSSFAALELETALGCSGLVIPQHLALEELVYSEQQQHIRKYCAESTAKQIAFVHAAMRLGKNSIAKTMARTWDITSLFPGYCKLLNQLFHSFLIVHTSLSLQEVG